MHAAHGVSWNCWRGQKKAVAELLARSAGLSRPGVSSGRCEVTRRQSVVRWRHAIEPSGVLCHSLLIILSPLVSLQRPFVALPDVGYLEIECISGISSSPPPPSGELRDVTAMEEQSRLKASLPRRHLGTHLLSLPPVQTDLPLALVKVD